MGLISYPAKLLLFGEHTALYGFPAIGFTIPLYMNLSFSRSPSWVLANKVTNDERVEKIFNYLDNNFPNLKKASFKIDSKIPQALGFGSSAALSLCFSAYIFGNRNIDLTMFLNTTKEIESIYHGKSSGIDPLIIILNSLSFLSKLSSKPHYKKIDFSKFDFYFLIGAIEREKSTKTLISEFNIREKNNTALKDNLQLLGELSNLALCSIENGDFDSFNCQINLAQEYLKNLGFSTKKLDLILNKGLEFGALSGKLSGAGGGGAFFFIVKDKEKVFLLREKLEKFLILSKIKLELPLKILHSTLGEFL